MKIMTMKGATMTTRQKKQIGSRMKNYYRRVRAYMKSNDCSFMEARSKMQHESDGIRTLRHFNKKDKKRPPIITGDHKKIREIAAEIISDHHEVDLYKFKLASQLIEELPLR